MARTRAKAPHGRMPEIPCHRYGLRQKTLGAEKVYNYSTSFGAYVTLRFLLEKAIPLPALPYVRQLSRLMKA